MADYYTEFAEIIPCENTRQQQWLLNRLNQYEETNSNGGWTAEKSEATDVYVYCEDWLNQEALTEILCEFQKRFGLLTSITISWVNHCSKKRPGAFTGGAALITGGMVAWFYPCSMAKQLANEIDPARALPHEFTKKIRSVTGTYDPWIRQAY